jgi:hypothetical protein
MIHPLIITSSGKVEDRQIMRVRLWLQYFMDKQKSNSIKALDHLRMTIKSDRFGC